MGTNRTMCSLVAPVAFVAIGIAIMMIVNEQPIYTTSNDTISTDYNLVDIEAPALTGPPLTLLTYLATKSFLGPFIIRHLLNHNGLIIIRELASKLPREMPPTYFPMSRLSAEDYRYHVRVSQDPPLEDLLSSGRGLDRNHHGNKSGYRTIMDYHRLYQSGKATPTMVMSRVLEGCDKLQHLHMFASLIPEDVMEQARASDKRWKSGEPLSVFDGVPITVKDMLSVKGHNVCSGSKFCRESEQDEIGVAKFRKAGAIILGMTVTAEFGVTPIGYSLWSDGPFNPYNTDYYPGGSSSGSAVSVATGLVPVSIGLDGGGSIRVPSAMSGVFGLAPTFGRVETGVVRYTNTKTGPLAATAQDAALAHALLGSVSSDKQHFYSQLYDGGVNGVPPPNINGLTSPITGMRLGIYWNHFRHSDPEIVEACSQTVKFLQAQGAEIVNITIPHMREIQMSHAAKILSEFGQSTDALFYAATELEANTAITVAMGKEVTAVEVLAAEKIRTWALDLLRNKIFREQRIDAIVSPMIGCKVPKPMKGFRSTGENNSPLVYKVMRFVPLSNFLGLPGMSVPVAYEQQTGLPIGFQLQGDAWMEHKLLRLASAIEARHLKRSRPHDNYYDPLSEWLN